MTCRQAQNTKSSYVTVGPESCPGDAVQTNKPIARIDGAVNKNIENVNSESITNIFNNVSFVGRGQDNTEGEYNVEMSPIESVRWLYLLLGTISSTDVSSLTDGSVWKHEITENLCNYKTLSIEGKDGGCDLAGNGQNYMIGRAFGCALNSLSINIEDGFIKMTPNIIAYGKFDVAFVVADESPEAASTAITNFTWASGVLTVTSTAHGLAVNDLVTLAGNNPSAVDGSYKVTSVADANTFTVALESDPGAFVAGGTVAKLSMFYFEKSNVKGLVAGDTVKFYEETTGTTEDVVVVYVDDGNDVVGFASVTSALFTKDNEARISLVPKTPSPNETILFTRKQFRVRMGDTLTEAKAADPINIGNLTLENDRAVETKNQSEFNVVSPTGYTGKVSLTRLFETVELRDDFRQRKPQAMVIEIFNDIVISDTDTNKQTYRVDIEIPKMVYDTYELPVAANALLEETVGGTVVHDEDEGYGIKFVVYNGQDDNYYTTS